MEFTLPSTFQLIVMLGGFIGSVVVIWKAVVFVKDLVHKFDTAVDAGVMIAKTLYNESTPNGGQSTKDLLTRIDGKLTDVIDMLGSNASMISMSITERDEKNGT